MFQIIALRPYISQKTNKEAIKHVFIAETTSLTDILISPKLDLIPNDERWNVYFTVQQNLPPEKTTYGYRKLRRFLSQQLIPFDIDNIDPTQQQKYIDAFHLVTQTDPKKTAALFSGNGLQLFVQTLNPFELTEFEKRKSQYDKIASLIQAELDLQKLPGNVDTSVWSPARLMRFPNTKNIKKDKGVKFAQLLTNDIQPQNFQWDTISGFEQIDKTETFEEYFDNKKVAVDSDFIVQNCNFLNWLSNKPIEAHEPHFYAAMSIVGLFPNKNDVALNIRDKINQYSPKSQVAHYSDLEIKEKMQQAVTSSAPRTCKNINTISSKCQGCAFRNQVKSPIQLKSPDFISTKDSGFHIFSRGQYIPQYHDLYKYFFQQFKPITVIDNEMTYIYNGKFYEYFMDLSLKNFAENHFLPKPKTHIVQEFSNVVKRNNVVQLSDFNAPDGYINLQNGILNIKTRELKPHSPSFYFKYILPFSYDPNADCPNFKRFLEQVTMGRQDLIDILQEFGGYAISGDSYWLHKILILVGEGRNGKSTFLNTLKEIAGKDNVSFASFDDLHNVNMRQTLEGKLFNMTEELSNKDLKDTSLLKQITGQGQMAVKMMYHQPYYITNRAKIIVATNEIPNFNDSSYGLAQRLCIVPFDKTFKTEEQDPHIHQKFKQEYSGIFNLFLKGYERLMKNEKLTFSATVDEEVTEQMKSANIIKQWLDESECVTVHPLNGKCYFAATQDLYKEFKNWVIDKSNYHYNNMSFDIFSRRFKLSISDGNLRKHRFNFNGRKVHGFYDVEYRKESVIDQIKKRNSKTGQTGKIKPDSEENNEQDFI